MKNILIILSFHIKDGAATLARKGVGILVLKIPKGLPTEKGSQVAENLGKSIPSLA